MALDKRCECPGMAAPRHPLFVTMISISQAGVDAGVDFPSKISVATNPFYRVRQLNGLADNSGKRRKKKRKGATYWQVDLAIGPFETGARTLQKIWAEKSRKVDCRLVAGVKFAALVDNIENGPKPPEGKEVVIYARDKKLLYRLLHEREGQLKKSLTTVSKSST